jgi:hypothetical protein
MIASGVRASGVLLTWPQIDRQNRLARIRNKTRFPWESSSHRPERNTAMKPSSFLRTMQPISSGIATTACSPEAGL